MKFLVYDEQLSSAARLIGSVFRPESVSSGKEEASQEAQTPSSAFSSSSSPSLTIRRSLTSTVRRLTTDFCKRVYQNEAYVSEDIRHLLERVAPNFIASWGLDWQDYYEEKVEEKAAPPISISPLTGEVSIAKSHVEEHLVEWINFVLAHFDVLERFVRQEYDSSDGQFASLPKSARVFRLMDSGITVDCLRECKRQLGLLFELHDLLYSKRAPLLTASALVEAIEQLKAKYGTKSTGSTLNARNARKCK